MARQATEANKPLLTQEDNRTWQTVLQDHAERLRLQVNQGSEYHAEGCEAGHLVSINICCENQLMNEWVKITF